jgi:hypothetical protein
VLGLTSSGRRRLVVDRQLMSELELPVEALDDAAVDRTIRLVRETRSDGPAGLRVRTAGTLDPQKLVRGLAERVIARAGTIYEGSRVTIARGRGPLRLETDMGPKSSPTKSSWRPRVTRRVSGSFTAAFFRFICKWFSPSLCVRRTARSSVGGDVKESSTVGDSSTTSV